MLHQTRGIVFRSIKYSETSMICKIYTEKFGLQSYMINGVRSNRSKTRQTLLQPLTLLNMIAYYRENKNLQRVRELEFEYLFKSLPFEIIKSSIGLFILEILNKTIQEEEEDPGLFRFIFNTIRSLDENQHVQNFHLIFMVRLSKYLGFAPGANMSSSNDFFDLREGVFTPHQPTHPNFLEGAYSVLLHHLTYGSEEELSRLHLNREQRKILIGNMLTYYELHLSNFKGSTSYPILESVLS